MLRTLLLAAAVLAALSIPAIAQSLTVYRIATDASIARLSVGSLVGAARVSLPFDAGRIVVGPAGQVISATAELNARAADGGFVNRQITGDSGLAVDRFPTIGFRSSRITQRGEEVEIAGDLTIRGVTRPARFTGTVRPRGRSLKLDLSGSIDRTAFGVTAGRPIYSRTATVSLDVLAAP